MENQKLCSHCKIVKNIENYSRNERTKDGLASICKKCSREYGKGWRKNNRERKREMDRDYYSRNKHKKRAYLKKYRKKTLTPEQRRQRVEKYNLLNPERKKLCIRRYKARQTKELRNNYIKGLVRKATGLQFKDIPIELIELKRTQIQLKRELRGTV